MSTVHHLFLLIKGGKPLSLGSEALRLLWQQTHLVSLWGQRRAPRTESRSAYSRKLLHYDERRPTHLQIADELIFSRGAAPVVCFHARLTENVE